MRLDTSYKEQAGEFIAVTVPKPKLMDAIADGSAYDQMHIATILDALSDLVAQHASGERVEIEQVKNFLEFEPGRFVFSLFPLTKGARPVSLPFFVPRLGALLQGFESKRLAMRPEVMAGVKQLSSAARRLGQLTGSPPLKIERVRCLNGRDAPTLAFTISTDQAQKISMNSDQPT